VGQFSRRTLIAAVDLLDWKFSQAAISRFVIELGPDVYQHIRTESVSSTKRLNDLKQFVDRHPAHPVDGGVLEDVIVDKAVASLPPEPPRYAWDTSEPEPPPAPVATFLRNLAADGFVVTDGTLRPKLPALLDHGGVMPNIGEEERETFQAAGSEDASDGAPVPDQPQPTQGPSMPQSAQPNRKVFIVHGHVDAARETVARFLGILGFEVIILHERPNQGRTIIEKFEANSDVSFVVVLLTPDDEGCKSRRTAQAPRAPERHSRVGVLRRQAWPGQSVRPEKG